MGRLLPLNGKSKTNHTYIADLINNIFIDTVHMIHEMFLLPAYFFNYIIFFSKSFFYFLNNLYGLILIGSGIGSVPLISLAINLQNSRPITFIRIASKEEDLIYEVELINIANKNTKFIYHSQIGRLNPEQIIKLYNKKEFYRIGGSPQMMKGTKKLLMKGGVNRAQIYGEKFNGSIL